MNVMTSVTQGFLASAAAPFWRLWSASTLSNLGDGIYQFALPLLALELTRAPSLVSGVTLALTLAWPVFGLHGGGIVDRFDRQSILAWVALMRVVVLGTLTVLLITDSLSLAAIYLAALVLGVGEVLADTALTALVPSVVERDELERANGRITAGQAIANTFVGPPLAGALLGVAGHVATGVATAAYGLAALSFGVVRVSTDRPKGVPAPHAARTWGVREGITYVWSNATLRWLTLFTAAMNVWWAAWTALFVLVAVSPGPMGLSTAGYGVVLSVAAIGGVLGSLAADRVRRALGTRNALLLDLVGTALLIGVPVVTNHPVLVTLAIFGASFGAAVWVVLVASIRQRLTPDELLGRVYSASRLISWGVLPLGAAGAGVAAELVGIRAVFLCGVVASIGLIPVFLARIRAPGLVDRQPAVAGQT
jgi:MFS family permease